MQAPVRIGETFNGGDLFVLQITKLQKAAALGKIVYQDSASSANSNATAYLCADQSQIFSQPVGKKARAHVISKLVADAINRYLHYPSLS